MKHMSYNELKLIFDEITKQVEGFKIDKNAPTIDLMIGIIEALPGEFVAFRSDIMLHIDLKNELFQPSVPQFFKITDSDVEFLKKLRE